MELILVVLFVLCGNWPVLQSAVSGANNEENIKTLHDYVIGAVVYKNIQRSKCYLQLTDQNKLKIQPDLNNVLPESKVWEYAGEKVYNFCLGYPTYLLHPNSFKPSNVENKSNVQKRSTQHYFVGRRRAQTQSQYLNFGKNGEPGKAEAESTLEGSKAVVTGTSGMGQAQSQSTFDNCEECYLQEQIIHLDRTQYPGQTPESAVQPPTFPTGPNGHPTYPGQPPTGTLPPGGQLPDRRPLIPSPGPIGTIPGQPPGIQPPGQVPFIPGPTPVGTIPGQPPGIQPPGQLPFIPGPVPIGTIPSQPPGQIPFIPGPAPIGTIPGQPPGIQPPGQRPFIPGPSPIGTIPGQPPGIQPPGQIPFIPGPAPIGTIPGQPPGLQPPGQVPFIPGPAPIETIPRLPPGIQPPGQIPFIPGPAPIGTIPSQPPGIQPPGQRPFIPGPAPIGTIPGQPPIRQPPGQIIPFIPGPAPIGTIPGQPPGIKPPGQRPFIPGPAPIGAIPGQPPGVQPPDQGPGLTHVGLQPVGPHIPSPPGHPLLPSDNQVQEPPGGKLHGQFAGEYYGNGRQYYDEYGRIIYSSGTGNGRTPQAIVPGEFSGKFAGNYNTNVGQSGKFAGTFAGQYEPHKYPLGTPIETGQGVIRVPPSTAGVQPGPVGTGVPQYQYGPSGQYVQPSTVAGGGILYGPDGQQYIQPGTGGKPQYQYGPGGQLIVGSGGQYVQPGQTATPQYGHGSQPIVGTTGVVYGPGGEIIRGPGIPQYQYGPGRQQQEQPSGTGADVQPGQTATPQYGPGGQPIVGTTGVVYGPGGELVQGPRIPQYQYGPGRHQQEQPGGTGADGGGGGARIPQLVYGVGNGGTQVGAGGTGISKHQYGPSSQLAGGPQYVQPGAQSGTNGIVPTYQYGPGGQVVSTGQNGYQYGSGSQYAQPSTGPGVPEYQYGADRQPIGRPQGNGGGPSGVPQYGPGGQPIGGIPQQYGPGGQLTGGTQQQYGSGGTPTYQQPSGGGEVSGGEIGTGQGQYLYGQQNGGGIVGLQKVPDDADSQAESSVQQINNETKATATAQGHFEGGHAQSQVQGSYFGTGSFSASAGSNDGKRGARTHVEGGENGALSSAQGNGGLGKSQAQVELMSETGDTTSNAQSSGFNHGTNTLVQASEKGGMADAQANGPGSTSSQAQIGFLPYDDNEKDEQELPFRGGGTASAQSGTHSGQTQTQIQGKFSFGIKYSGSAQAGSGNTGNFTFGRNQTQSQFNFGKMSARSGNKTNGIASERQQGRQAVSKQSELSISQPRIRVVNSTTPKPNEPTKISLPTAENQTAVPVPGEVDTYSAEYDDGGEYYDDLEEEVPVSQSTQTRNSNFGHNTRNQRQHIILDPLEDLDATVYQARGRTEAPLKSILEPGEIVPGNPSIQIPQGFRGRITSIANGPRTTATGPHSQAQSVSLKPGTGRIIYKKPKPIYAVSSRTVTHNGYYGSGAGYTYQPVQYQFKSSKGYPGFVAVTKSETGSKDIYTGQKTPAVSYSQSSTCGIFTNTCVYIKGNKVCMPKPKTNPDGSPIIC